MKRLLSLALMAALALSVLPVVSAIADNPCPPLSADEVPTFASDFVDITRAGGEPIMEALNDGTLLWGSHAGTTHFYAPASLGQGNTNTGAFIENYQGQTYQYFSDDGGVSWDFVSRQLNPTTIIGGTPASGFSDPVFAVDEAGTVYISEINLANIAVSASTDGGRNYELRSLAAFTSSDRQWMAADTPGRLFMSANGVGAMTTTPSTSPGFQSGGHVLALSKDGGTTWGAPEKPNPNGNGDTLIDRSNGDLYELTQPGSELQMGVYRGIRDIDSNFRSVLEHYTIAEGIGVTGVSRQIGPTFDMDAEGNIYAVWSETGNGPAGRETGIYYAWSAAYDESKGDDALEFSDPIRIDLELEDGTNPTSIWPWIAVGDPGHVAISYLDNDKDYGFNAEGAGPEDGWNVITAATKNGMGCENGSPSFTTVQASAEPIHYGTICQSGTICQAFATDRRLGDYFSNQIAADGSLIIAVSDTTQGGSISLPHVIRQTGGLDFGFNPANPAPGEAGAPAQFAPAAAGLDALN